MTANTFGVHACTVSKTVPIVIQSYEQNTLTKISATSFNRGGNEDKMRPMKYGMYQAFGCVNGTHIRINAPCQSPADNVCYKLFHSLDV